MKILHIGPVLIDESIEKDNIEFGYYDQIGADGPTRVIISLAEALADIKDMKIGILSTKKLNVSNELLPNNIEYLKPYSGSKHNFFINTKRWIEHITNKFGKPDIINFHGVYDIFCIMLAKAMRKKGWNYFITPHGGLRPIAQKRDRIKKIIANPLFFNEYLFNADFIHALTAEEMKDIKMYHKKLSKVRISHSGLPKLFNKLPSYSKNTTKKEPIVIGFIGSIYTHIKGIDLLLDAVSNYQQLDDVKPIKFIFLGPIHRTEDKKCVDKFIKRMKYPNLLEFKGPKYGKEKWAQLSNFDIFVLTSRTEGMPIVVLEAMAFGKPIMISEGTNMGVFVKEANCGWVIDGSAQSILKLLLDISKIERNKIDFFGNNARKYLLDKLLMENAAQAFIKMINE